LFITTPSPVRRRTTFSLRSSRPERSSFLSTDRLSGEILLVVEGQDEVALCFVFVRKRHAAQADEPCGT
jgi:hypothetical protein